MHYISSGVAPAGQALPAEAGDQAGGMLNDASQLSPTRVARHLVMAGDRREDLIGGMRAELAEARAAGRPFIVSAARHSMGAHSLAEDGTTLTLDGGWLEPDTGARTFRVAAGMRWQQVITELDALGFSPKVMQSNNNFGVASTFSVNAHGWPVRWSAFGSTVRSLELMLADGDVITCSRKENAEAFAMAMGGYGLTGAIVELEVDMTPNVRLAPTYEIMPARDFGNRFLAALDGAPDIQMAYGRLDVTIGSFFDEALMITYRPTVDQENLPPAQSSGFLSKASRHVFRAQLDSDRIKSLRWNIETGLVPRFGGEATRNNLMNEPVATLDDRDPTRTDILHEYFVSPDRFSEFIDACKDVIPSSYQQLLNVTLRFVDTDNESILAYATEPRIAAVMLFSQEMTVRGEADMARMTSALIERTLAIGGTYYLPYRLHATGDQFRRGYPRAPEFAAYKRRQDPDLVFRHALWDRYLANL